MFRSPRRQSNAEASASAGVSETVPLADDAMGTVWSYLDMTALRRQEIWEDSPKGYPQSRPYKWWNWHDSYVRDASPDPKWVEVSDAGEAAFRSKDAGAKA